MKAKKIVILLICCLLLAGCPKKRQLDQLGIINARGIDVDEEETIKINFVIFQFEQQSANLTKIVTGTGKTVNGAMVNANYETNFLLGSGKIQLDLYGRETIEQGIRPYLDNLNRDPSTPDTMYLAISDTTAEEMLSVQEQGISTNIGQFLHNTIEQSTTADYVFPRVSMQKFMLYLMDVGRDPILPIFTLENETPKITGIGVLQDDRLVGELPIEDKYLINLPLRDLGNEVYELSIPIEPFRKDLEFEKTKEQNQIDLSLKLLKNKGSTKLINKENLEFETDITLSADLNEISIYESLDFKDKAIVKKLEKEIEKTLTKKYENMLTYLQEVNSDVLSYGESYRAQVSDHRLKKSEWRKLYPQIDVKFNINVKLIHTGESF